MIRPYQYWWWRYEAFRYMQEHFYPKRETELYTAYTPAFDGRWNTVTRERQLPQVIPMVTRDQIKEAARYACRTETDSPRLLRDVYRSLVDTYKSTHKLTTR